MTLRMVLFICVIHLSFEHPIISYLPIVGLIIKSDEHKLQVGLPFDSKFKLLNWNLFISLSFKGFNLSDLLYSLNSVKP